MSVWKKNKTVKSLCIALQLRSVLMMVEPLCRKKRHIKTRPSRILTFECIKEEELLYHHPHKPNTSYTQCDDMNCSQYRRPTNGCRYKARRQFLCNVDNVLDLQNDPTR